MKYISENYVFLWLGNFLSFDELEVSDTISKKWRGGILYFV